MLLPFIREKKKMILTPNENYESKVILWHSPMIHTTAILTVILKFFILSHLPSGTITSAGKSMPIITVSSVLAVVPSSFREPRLLIAVTEQLG